MANDSDADDRDGLDVLGVLAEPTRRRVYDHVVANGDWVSRESVAAALGLERPTVAHHLDRLAGDGLLEVEFRRLTGRQGPGAEIRRAACRERVCQYGQISGVAVTFKKKNAHNKKDKTQTK